MKIKLILLSAAIVLCNSLQTQTDALLWKISGNGLKNPSYVFGTVHAYCDKDRFMKPVLLDAINSTDIVAMELNLNDFSTFVALMKASMKESEKPISALLDAAGYKTVDSACLAILGDSLKNLDNKTPMALMGKLYLSEAITGCKPLPIDFMIAELAKRNNKVSYGLETADFQDSVLKSIPDSIQIKWLLELCRDLGKAKSDFALLLETYNAQKSQMLYDISFRISPEMLLLKDLMLDQRNINWVNFLKNNMSGNSYFVAVGAAHLAGDKGMIELLKQAGYTLTPIFIEF